MVLLKDGPAPKPGAPLKGDDFGAQAPAPASTTAPAAVPGTGPEDALDLQSQLSYPGWESDAAEVEKLLAVMISQLRAQLSSIHRRQEMQALGREFPDLRALDDLKLELSYPGWRLDAEIANDCCEKDPQRFSTQLETMRRKQRLYNCSAHPPDAVELFWRGIHA